jgi:hypothetical protein
LRPHLADAHITAIGKVVLGTVQGDLHDIGKNLVGMMLEGAGFEVIDLVPMCLRRNSRMPSGPSPSIRRLLGSLDHDHATHERGH